MTVTQPECLKQMRNNCKSVTYLGFVCACGEGGCRDGIGPPVLHGQMGVYIHIQVKIIVTLIPSEGWNF